MQTPTVPALVIRREYSAPPERVYAAWTDPQLAKEFLCPEGITIGDIAMDVRIGGRYRIQMIRPEGEPFVAYGVYRDVQPARRLSMTWIWEEDNKDEERETLLTVEFNPHGSGTELILTHEYLASLESRAGHEHGWTTMLQKMYGLSDSCTIRADIAAPPQRVFSALASPEITRWWVRPGVFDTREWSGDVRPGGRWSASGIGGGNPYALEGEFLDVQAPQRLVHTWHLAGMPAAPTTVSYELEPTASGTRITLRHEGFASPQACTNTAIGWETSFERLKELLNTPA
jgi:uncharacterized protein YndB with AHSA1/START domain